MLQLLIGTATAQTVTFDLNAQQAADAGVDVDAVEQDLGGAITDQLGLADPDAYLRQFANADAMALKGMGVDYASNPKKFSIGGVVGSSVSGVPLSFVRGPTELPEGGFAFMASLCAGVNLGMFTPGDKGPLDHLMVYVNGLAFSPPANRTFRASMYNFGAHAQLKLFGPVNLKVVEWGGLDLTAGYERSFYALELTQALPLTQATGPGSLTWTATGDYRISAGAGTIPLELSTNLRLLVATAYVGAGLDLNTATATSAASLSGPVEAKVAGESADIGSVGVSIDGAGDADPAVGRLFVGVQANVLLLKVFGHLNVGLNDTYGGFVGVRIAL
ncbi:MAG: hypothetical protein ABMB14_03495 [Myxococcota bacterium]